MIGCGACGCTNAHVAHRADYHHLINALLVQNLLELGVAEGVSVILQDHGFTKLGRDGENEISTPTH